MLLDEKYVHQKKYLAQEYLLVLVQVDIPVLNTSFDAHISHRATHVSTENRTFRVTVDIDPSIPVNPNLLSTLHIFDYINPQALLIPGSIISENAASSIFRDDTPWN